MAGYSGTPLQKKLGIKEGLSLFILQPPDLYFDWISPLPPNVKVKTKLSDEVDFIHLFVKDQKTFSKEFIRSKKQLKKEGMMWISWPKKASRVPTDLDENIIREFGLKNGLVDVKVCAIDDVWSGLKFMFRIKDR
ncbi:MAG TPA: DUF3052 domain-containing protein [Cyclobacteriaceae bacterium]|nr:DUF3052 domain-containing protein [Cyclobacteriaceae bacterium]